MNTDAEVSHNGQMLASGQQGQNADVLLWSLLAKTKETSSFLRV